MNDEALTSAKDLEREVDLFIEQMERDNRSHLLSGASLLLLFLVGTIIFFGTVFWFSSQISDQVDSVLGVPNNTSTQIEPSERS